MLKRIGEKCEELYSSPEGKSTILGGYRMFFLRVRLESGKDKTDSEEGRCTEGIPTECQKNSTTETD